MPQRPLPFFPQGVTDITAELAFMKENGRATYFNGHMPVFIHEENDRATFRPPFQITARPARRNIARYETVLNFLSFRSPGLCCLGNLSHSEHTNSVPHLGSVCRGNFSHFPCEILPHSIRVTIYRHVYEMSSRQGPEHRVLVGPILSPYSPKA